MSLYDTDKSKLLNRFYDKTAVLACAVIDADTVCLGGLECAVKMYLCRFGVSRRYDFHKKQERILGYHHAAVSCVQYIPSLRIPVFHALTRRLGCERRLGQCGESMGRQHRSGECPASCVLSSRKGVRDGRYEGWVRPRSPSHV